MLSPLGGQEFRGMAVKYPCRRCSSGVMVSARRIPRKGMPGEGCSLVVSKVCYAAITGGARERSCTVAAPWWRK